MTRVAQRDYHVLADFRRSLRALNRAVDEGVRVAGLTLPQQGVLLSLRARGGKDVPLAVVRKDMLMDDATTADLLARLGQRGLVARRVALRRDRRAADISLTARGRAALDRSMLGVRDRIQRAAREGELNALRRDVSAYLLFYGVRER